METFVLKSGGKRRYEASGGEADTSKDRTHEAATEHRPKKKQLASCRTAPTLHWTKIAGENLDCDYVKLYSKKEADDIFLACERSLIYNSGHLAKVQLFGKWVDIPRKQVLKQVNKNLVAMKQLILFATSAGVTSNFVMLL